MKNLLLLLFTVGLTLSLSAQVVIPDPGFENDELSDNWTTWFNADGDGYIRVTEDKDLAHSGRKCLDMKNRSQGKLYDLLVEPETRYVFTCWWKHLAGFDIYIYEHKAETNHNAHDFGKQVGFVWHHSVEPQEDYVITQVPFTTTDSCDRVILYIEIYDAGPAYIDDLVIVEGISDSIPPAKPEGLIKLSASIDDGISIAWDVTPDIMGGENSEQIAQDAPLYKVIRDGKEVAIITDTTFTDNKVAPNTNYTYSIIALDNGYNESEASDELTINSSGISSINKNLNSNISIYPNPVQNVLNLSDVPQNSTIEIVSVLGAQILMLNNFNEQLISIPTSDLATGIHIITIKNSKGQLLAVEKFFKQ